MWVAIFFTTYSTGNLYNESAFYSPFSAMVSIHFSGGCDPGSSPGRGSLTSFLILLN